jgi:hypothetical protein
MSPDVDAFVMKHEQAFYDLQWIFESNSITLSNFSIEGHEFGRIFDSPYELIFGIKMCGLIF